MENVSCDHTCTHDGSAATFAATCHMKQSLNFVLKKMCIQLYPPKAKLGGVYRNQPVRPSMYLVSATPPKPLIGFL